MLVYDPSNAMVQGLCVHIPIESSCHRLHPSLLNDNSKALNEDLEVILQVKIDPTLEFNQSKKSRDLFFEAL